MCVEVPRRAMDQPAEIAACSVKILWKALRVRGGQTVDFRGIDCARNGGVSRETGRPEEPSLLEGPQEAQCST